MNSIVLEDIKKNVKTPPPYKTFSHKGECFVYDTSNCVFFHIDEPTRGFLDLCLEYPMDEAKKRFLDLNRYNKSTCESVFNEVEIMGKNGLFTVPNYAISDDAFEKQLEERYNSAWNKLELSLSEGCNLACKYCYCSTCRDIPSKGLMTENIARQAITWLFAMSGKSEQVSITFFGGEPLLNKPVLRFAIEYSQKLAKLHGKKVFYSMTTNGTLLDDEVIGYIKRYNFGLMVSLDGPKELHDKQCPTQNGDGSYDAAVAGIKKLMARRRSVTVRGTMIHPLPRMLDLIKFYEDFGFTRIVMGKATNPINPSGVDCDFSDLESYFKQSDEEIVPWILNELKNKKTPKYYPYSSMIESLEKNNISRKVSPFRCGACRGTTTVGADGALYPCHRFTGMKGWKIGNIYDGPDYALCKNFWRKYYNSISKQCLGCWMYSLCKGLCPWELANSDGTFKIPYLCNHSENFLKNCAYILLKKKSIDLQKSSNGEA